MHILFLTPAFPPLPGGGERYVRSLALNLVGRGHHVTVVTSTAVSETDFWQRQHPKSIAIKTDNGIRVIRCQTRGMRGGRNVLMLWRKLMTLISALPGDQTAVLLQMSRYIPHLSQFDDTLARLPNTIDLIHGFNISWEYPLFAGWKLARERHLPFVVTPFIHLGQPGQKSAHVVLMDHHRRLLADADRTLTLTSVSQAGLIKRGIAGGKVSVIGGGLDPVPKIADFTETLRRFDLQRPFTLFIGRTSHDKGAFHATQAIRQLRRQHILVTLVMIGTITPQFNRFYRRLGADEKGWIRPLGNLNDSDKHALLAASQLLLLPSRMDSFGIVILEAWAHGKPVIGGRSGGIPGVIDDGQNGLLVPFGAVNELAKAIARLCSDDARRHKMGQHGRQKVAEHYTWEQTTQRVLMNYEHVLGYGRH